MHLSLDFFRNSFVLRALAYAATAAVCVYGFSTRPDTRAKLWARHEALAREKNGGAAEVGSTVFADTNAWKKSGVGAVPTRGDSDDDDDDDDDD